MKHPRLLAAAALLAGVTTVTGCASNPRIAEPGPEATRTRPSVTPGTRSAGSSEPTSGSHNAADVTFAIAMLRHHEHATQLSDKLLSKQGIDPAVTSLATRMKATQGPESDQMNTWLATWRQQDPRLQARGGTAEADPDDEPASQTDLDALDHAIGADASKLFLTTMIKYHQGALGIARRELDEGQDGDVKQIALTITTLDQAQIIEMNWLLPH
ncbi:MAG: DUF305 domain-containing protein [Propionibacteriaceae bacterium]|nr:MAG: DUF305 domain-containing protein [Propionibacteriaceae bacterium]